MDQDSVVDADLVSHLLETWAVARAANRSAADTPDCIAVVGSSFRDAAGRPDETRPSGSAGAEWLEVESVISSGSLLALAVYEQIGPFRDEFFIDHVDTEYCLRARRQGFRILQTRRPSMSHTVGAPTRHKGLGKVRWTTNHSARPALLHCQEQHRAVARIRLPRSQPVALEKCDSQPALVQTHRAV